MKWTSEQRAEWLRTHKSSEDIEKWLSISRDVLVAALVVFEGAELQAPKPPWDAWR